MGHERIGVLPKTKRWRNIVSEISSPTSTPDVVAEIASNTLDALGSRYKQLATDANVREAFNFLIEVARGEVIAKQSRPPTTQTPLALITHLAERLGGVNGSLETRELVKRAVGDAIATWYRDNQSPQTGLFGDTASTSPWPGFGTGASFCELSRLYLSKLTERYLNYFLDREASAVIPSLHAREEFRDQLRRHVSDVSQLSFESAKITQSYAAGWFNKYARTEAPTAVQQRKFLAYAFEKLRAEFRCEGKQ